MRSCGFGVVAWVVLGILASGLWGDEGSVERRVERSSTKAMQVACAQLDIRPTVEENTRLIIEALESETRQGTRLVTFPECALTSYKTEIIAKLTQQQIDAGLERVAAACKRLGIYAVVGSAYRRDDKWYNGAFIISPAGRVIKRYDKLHVVRRFFAEGDALAIFRVDDVPVTIMICHDERYPEILRIPVLAGAKAGIYISCESKTPAKRDNYRCQVIGRAVENHISVIHCNSGDGGVDGGSHGHSRIINPRGDVLAEADEKVGTAIRAVIHPDESSDTHAQRGAGTPSLQAFWAEGLRVLRQQNPEFFAATGVTVGAASPSAR